MSEQSNEPEKNAFENIQNVIQSDRIFGIRKRNLVEALIFSLMVLLIIANINFVNKVKLILLVTTIPTVFYFNIHGFKNRSLTELIIDELSFRHRRRKLHLRSIDYVRKQNNQAGFFIEGESIIEKATYIAKRLIKAAFRK